MTYGVPACGAHPCTHDEATSRLLLRQAPEAGINFFDTANAYSDGRSEEIVGRALTEFARRGAARRGRRRDQGALCVASGTEHRRAIAQGHLP